MYFLIDLERSLGMGRTFYWKASRRGYTTDITEAGVFSATEANKIVKSDYDNQTIMIHIDMIDKIAKGF